MLEKPEDRKFLLEMPDDTESACVHVQNIVRARLLSRELVMFEMVVAVKEALRLPIDKYDMGATIVITNAIREAMEQCGFASPEIIFQKLKERKRTLQDGETGGKAGGTAGGK